MARISESEYKIIQSWVSNARVDEFNSFLSQADLPDADDTSIESAYKTVSFLKEAFINNFTILDGIVAVCGRGPASQSDTHFRGRDLERILGGSFDGKPQADFGYAELKLTEVNEKDNLVQLVRAGTIFTKSKGEYNIVSSYEDSCFFKKMQSVILCSYEKVGKQLGFEMKTVNHFSVNDPRWKSELKEDWESIAAAMTQAIADEKAGKIIRKASGILSSTHKTPNGLLSVRSDGVMLTNKFFRMITEKE